jgi:RNA polymerase sigma-70 factor (ECF subfamily)
MQTGLVMSYGATMRRYAPPPELSDEALIEQIAEGDRGAMHVLYARHNPRVYRFILRLVGREAIAEELVSEVFLEAWRQADRFAGRSQVSTWLLAIARYKAISVLRSRHDADTDDSVLNMIEDPQDDPETRLAKSDRATTLQQCLAKLVPAHREIIDLVYYHEKSVKEASDIVGIPESTVKTRMFYARKRLAELLSEAGVDRLAA